MNKLKVTKVNSDVITFDNGLELYSHHDQDCCESHYLSMSDLTIDDFDDLQFDLTDDKFFRRVEDYGIELIPIKGFSVRIPGYGSNNGYYSSNLSLILKGEGVDRMFDISECQVNDEY